MRLKLTLLSMLIAAVCFVGGSSAQKLVRRKRLPPFTACLPPDVKADDIVVYGFNGKRNITVAEKVKELGGRCRNRQLVGPDKKRIRFFRIQCWGYPHPDYERIRAEEKRQLEVLEAKHRVIVLGCDPRLP